MEEPDEQLLQVSDLLKLHPTLGLPHFQRGGVWPDSARGRLLESLFHDTPCGSIILWKPAGPVAGAGAPGLPFPGNREQDVQWLVIDGQQRMRALRSTLGALSGNGRLTGPDDPEEAARDMDAEPADGGLPKVWCLNLQALAEVAPVLEGRLADQPLFVRVGDPRRNPQATARDRRNPRYRFNLWPLDLLLRGDRPALEACDLRLAKGATTADVRRHFDSIFARTRAIASRRLLVVRRREDLGIGRFALDEVVHLYNRINSAGVQAESEERVFATLVRIEPHTSDWLAELFEAVHGDTGAPSAADAGLRDLVLRRAQERSFGFRLFLRALVHAASYHLNLSLGSSAFSFDALASSEVLRRLRRLDESGASVASALQNRASRAVLALARILREDFGCDGFQFLPETASLVLPMEILVAYEDADATRPLLRWLVLALMLNERKQPELMKLVRAIRSAPDLAACREVLLGDDRLRTTAKSLSDRLASSNAIQDRFVLLLYWLVRRNGARDLSYQNATGTPSARCAVDLRSWRGSEPLVSMNMHGEAGVPQKQHIVPFVLLDRILGDVKRSGSSPANNIGNFTYISPALNHYDGGLGAEPMRWEVESTDNLRAHLLLDAGVDAGSNPLRDLFGVAIDEKASPLAKAHAFDDFCANRRSLIAKGLHGWMEELREAVDSSPVPFAQRLPPLLEQQPKKDSAPRTLETILELLGEDQREAAVRLMDGFAGRGFVAQGKSSSIQFGFRTGDGGFCPLIGLDSAGLWLSLKKQDRRALSEAESLAFDEGACEFGPFFRPDKPSGCAVKPNALAPQVAAFADFLVGWQEVLLGALQRR
jgi:hypothetical protein